MTWGLGLLGCKLLCDLGQAALSISSTVKSVLPLPCGLTLKFREKQLSAAVGAGLPLPHPAEPGKAWV